MTFAFQIHIGYLFLFRDPATNGFLIIFSFLKFMTNYASNKREIRNPLCTEHRGESKPIVNIGPRWRVYLRRTDCLQRTH